MEAKVTWSPAMRAFCESIRNEKNIVNTFCRIAFVINGHRYPITETHAVSSNRLTQENGVDYCQINIYSTDQTNIILGDVFLRAYCVVHNYKNRSLSFAAIKSTSITSTNGQPNDLQQSPARISNHTIVLESHQRHLPLTPSNLWAHLLNAAAQLINKYFAYFDFYSMLKLIACYFFKHNLSA